MAKSSSTDLSKRNLHTLEQEIAKLKSANPTPTRKQKLLDLTAALNARKRQIKAQVMEFEQTNNRHLLIFDSTHNFSKIAGRSVLFYTMCIADRIHRRFNLKQDSDLYSKSENGIVSLRLTNDLIKQLATINIFLDQTLSTDELHFFRLDTTFSEERIAKLQDRSKQDIERITNIVLPKSPNPLLYHAISQTNHHVYFMCKHMADAFARETIGKQLVLSANQLTVSYLQFANTSDPYATTDLAQILHHASFIKHSMANLEQLRLAHHQDILRVLESLVDIEHLAGKQYRTRLNKKSKNS